jgi:hypothetical protein
MAVDPSFAGFSPNVGNPLRTLWFRIVTIPAVLVGLNGVSALDPPGASAALVPQQSAVARIEGDHLTWYLRRPDGAGGFTTHSFVYGLATDKPLWGDWRQRRSRGSAAPGRRCQRPRPVEGLAGDGRPAVVPCGGDRLGLHGGGAARRQEPPGRVSGSEQDSKRFSSVTVGQPG